MGLFDWVGDMLKKITGLIGDLSKKIGGAVGAVLGPIAKLVDEDTLNIISRVADGLAAIGVPGASIASRIADKISEAKDRAGATNLNLNALIQGNVNGLLANSFAPSAPAVFDGGGVIDALMKEVREMTTRITNGLGSAMELATGKVGNVLEDVGDTITTRLRNALHSSVNAIDNLLDSATTSAARTLDAVVDPARELAQNIKVGVTDLIKGLDSRTLDILGGISSGISNVIDRTSNQLGDVYGLITSNVGAALDVSVNTTRELVGSLGGAIDTSLASLGNVSDRLLGRVSSGFEDLLGAAGSVSTRIGNAATSSLRSLEEGSASLLSRVSSGIESLIDALVGAAGSVADRLGEFAEGVGRAARELAESLNDGIRDNLALPVANAFKTLWDHIQETREGNQKALAEGPGPLVLGALGKLGVPDDVARKIAASLTQIHPAAGIPAILALAFGAPMMLGMLGASAMTPVANQIAQEINQAVRPQLMGVPDLMEGLHRGEFGRAYVNDQMSQHGYTDDKTEHIISLHRRLLAEGDLLTFWLRGLMTDQELQNYMRSQGVSDQDIERLKDAAFWIPPVGDLIRFAVRETFTPDVRREYGMDEGFPTDILPPLAKQGVAEEWARHYWAAHWELPSPTQAYEMLHRGVIDERQLLDLLTSQDYMPFWREKMMAISYNVPGRIDVRRMLAIGVITEEEATRRHMDMGYTRSDAELMTRFALEANKPARERNPQELEDLGRAQILGLLEDHVIDGQQARAALVEWGYTEDTAELLIAQRMIDLDRKERKEVAALLVAQAVAGKISETVAFAALAAEGFSARELAAFKLQIQRQIEAKTELPTRADLDKFVAAGIIDQDTYLETMKRIGFSADWAKRYLELVVINSGIA